MNYLERIAASATDSLLSPRIQPAGASVHGDAEAFELEAPMRSAPHAPYAGDPPHATRVTERRADDREPNRGEPCLPEVTAPDRDAVARAATREVEDREPAAKSVHTDRITAQTNLVVAQTDHVIESNATRTGGVSESDRAAGAGHVAEEGPRRRAGVIARTDVINGTEKIIHTESVVRTDRVVRTDGELHRGARPSSRPNSEPSLARTQSELHEPPAADRTEFVVRAPRAWRSRARSDSLAADRDARLTDPPSHVDPASPHAAAAQLHVSTLPTDVVVPSPARRAAGIARSDAAEQAQAAHDRAGREPRISIGRIDVTVRGGVSFVPPAPSLPSAPPANAPLFNRFALGG
ncbi:MAG TPA: hypothetical protein VK669_09560 [Candidatus Limnocylindrales bacterium]|nr:hypothetical protein [Candidatus Limnocylindrales bacterium]